ncbi:polysaccharide pyruvyl transferase family protein [Clavibacter sp. VKM Ac-2872]|uniref:polysaccharide pyruvyl transferase family protein n=1 Tax=Clavibacter sp. VKM Ac-2872 TaxID=2783812 RepID=UPI00188C1545|nr:polysaccharide pyruvyl transferase family protein [Clavibacter sp. VKM Ac-2872]MBF4623283.1 polysaccharide pyruvyl transferase family protein [Clavibacter sp. VKM Ac-2872]
MRTLIVSADRTLASGHPQNLGDAFLTDALSERLRRAGHETVIADFGQAARVDSTEERARVGGVRGLADLVRQVDAVVVGGGTLLADDQPARPFAGLPRLMAVTGLIARTSRTPLVVFGVGADPVTRRRARLALRAGLDGARIWTRDPDSAGRAAGYSKLPVEVAADVSLFAAPELAEMAAPADGRRGAVVALNATHSPEVTLAHVQALEERFGEVVFVSMDQGDDSDAGALQPEVRARLTTEPGDHGWGRAAAIMADREVVIASRMHAMYLGTMLTTPVVAVGGATKVGAFTTEFGTRTEPAFDRAVRTAIGGSADAGASSTTAAALVAATARLDAAFEEMTSWVRRTA